VDEIMWRVEEGRGWRVGGWERRRAVHKYDVARLIIHTYTVV